MTTELDANRLMVVIRERKILAQRLERLLDIAKQDNKGDVFKINRLLKFHKNALHQMEVSLQDKINKDYKQAQARVKNQTREEEAAINRLRVEISNWSLSGI